MELDEEKWASICSECDEKKNSHYDQNAISLFNYEQDVSYVCGECLNEKDAYLEVFTDYSEDIHIPCQVVKLKNSTEYPIVPVMKEEDDRTLGYVYFYNKTKPKYKSKFFEYWYLESDSTIGETPGRDLCYLRKVNGGILSKIIRMNGDYRRIVSRINFNKIIKPGDSLVLFRVPMSDDIYEFDKMDIHLKDLANVRLEVPENKVLNKNITENERIVHNI